MSLHNTEEGSLNKKFKFSQIFLQLSLYSWGFQPLSCVTRQRKEVKTKRKKKNGREEEDLGEEPKRGICKSHGKDLGNLRRKPLLAFYQSPF